MNVINKLKSKRGKETASQLPPQAPIEETSQTNPIQAVESSINIPV